MKKKRNIIVFGGVAAVAALLILALLTSESSVESRSDDASAALVVKDYSGTSFWTDGFLYVHSDDLDLSEFEPGRKASEQLGDQNLDKRLLAEINLDKLATFTGELHLYTRAEDGVLSARFLLDRGIIEKRLEKPADG